MSRVATGPISARRHDRSPWPTIETVWIAVAISLPAVLSFGGTIWLADLGYQIPSGNVFLDSGEILRADPFTFTVDGAPWVNQQWGAQVLLAFFYRVGGFEALSLTRAVMIAMVGSFVFLACRARGCGTREAALLTTLGICVSLAFLGIRPQLFAMPLFAAVLWILATREQHPKRIWWLPPIAIIWANVHGSFVLLPVMVFLAALESVGKSRRDRLRLLIGVGTVATLATLVNPFGFGAWRYVIDLTTNPVIRERVTEWAPVTLRDPFGWILFGSAVPVVYLLGRRGAPASRTDLLWLGVFFGAALLAVRSVAWWGFVAPVVVAGLLPPTPSAAHRPGHRLVNVAVMMALCVSALVLFPWFREPRLVLAPEDLTIALGDQTQPGDRLFVAQPYASWIELMMPDRKVFVDSRIELFPEGLWDQYVDVVDGRANWGRILDRWEVDAVVAEPTWQLLPFIQTDPGWRMVMRDEDGSVFVRAAAATR